MILVVLLPEIRIQSFFQICTLRSKEQPKKDLLRFVNKPHPSQLGSFRSLALVFPSILLVQTKQLFVLFCSDYGDMVMVEVTPLICARRHVQKLQKYDQPFRILFFSSSAAFLTLEKLNMQLYQVMFVQIAQILALQIIFYYNGPSRNKPLHLYNF